MPAPQRPWTGADETTWPKLAAPKKYTPPAASSSSQNQHSWGVNASYDAALDAFQKVGPGGVATHVQPDCTQDKDAIPASNVNLSRSFIGIDEQRLSTGAVSRSPSARSTTPPSTGRTKPPPALLPPPALRIDTGRLSYRDVARKSTPPASPTAASRPTSPILAAAKQSVWLPAPSALNVTQVVETKSDPFPPLSPAGGNRGIAPTLATRSYATAAHSKAPATSAIAAAVSESPTATTAKVIKLNITSTRPITPTNGPGPPRLSPLNESPITPSRSRPRKKANTTTGQSPSRLNLPERSRSASVSSVATSIITTASSSRSPLSNSSKATSIAPSPGPNAANKKKRLSSASTTTLPSPSWETEEWYDSLVKFAREMRAKNSDAWKKILRCDPKDTSKMKWAEFDNALKALGFKVNARGGSDLEYTPTLFGDNAQPISYHRPHPGQEFSLGDLKAKSNSFRLRYPGPVAALHQAWGLTDTRL